jgi:hypothetical protein
MKNRGRGGEGTRSLPRLPSHAPRFGERQSPDWRPLPPSYAPRNASIPCALTRLRILPVTTRVYPLQPKILSVLSVPLWQIHCFYTLADSLSLFALFFRLPFFIFNSLRTLLPKHPGVGGCASRSPLRELSVFRLSALSFPLRSLRRAGLLSIFNCRLSTSTSQC